jgi:hypothetical protein
MMTFGLEVLRARKGDCLLLHYGTEDAPRLMLIDGGPSDVYGPQLEPRLLELQGDQDTLPIDVVMVSHIDDDHIKGILDLIKAQRPKARDLHLNVSSLWFNSFDDLLNSTPAALGQPATASILAGVNPAVTFASITLEGEGQHQTLDVLSSVPQGRSLRDGAEELGWTSNHKFNGGLILATDESKPVKLNNLKITVVGPMQPELLALQEAHDRWVKEHNAGQKKTPEAMLAAFTDKSVPNLSSIVVLVDVGEGDDMKRILLTGDARGDKILEGLALVKALDENGELEVDILKVPHHGSDNNMTTEFFERVKAKHYVFSGDGEHGNPERATLQMLLDARGLDDDYTIHLTYEIDDIDEKRKADWKKKPAAKQGGGWSAAKQALAAFFDANAELKKRVKVVQEGEPHIIGLG